MPKPAKKREDDVPKLPPDPFDEMIRNGTRWCQQGAKPMDFDRIHDITSWVFQDIEGPRFTKTELKEVLGYWMQRGDHQNNAFNCLHGVVVSWLADELLGKRKRRRPTPKKELARLLKIVCWIRDNRMDDKMYGYDRVGGRRR